MPSGSYLGHETTSPVGGVYWATGQNYFINDLIVGADGSFYKCILTHVAGVFATDLTASKWMRLGFPSTSAKLSWDEASGNMGITGAFAGFGILPIGSIVAWMGGSFSALGNGGAYTQALGTANTIASANIYLTPLGFKVCDGNAPNDALSPIFNTAAKYLPDLTGNRFLMGSTISAGVGGSNSILAHTHTLSDHTITQPAFNVPSHFHGKGTIATTGVASGGASVDHSHTVSAHNHGGGNHTHRIPVVNSLSSGAASMYSTAGAAQYDSTQLLTSALSGDTIASQSPGTGGVSVDHSHTTTIPNANFTGSVGATGGSNGDAAFSATLATSVALSTHTVSGTQPSIDSRPVYMGILYIMRIK